MSLKEVLKNLGKVFKNIKYIILSIFVALIFYVLNVMIVGWGTIASLYSLLGFLGIIKLIFNMALGFSGVITEFSFATIVIISILIGMFFSLISYKIFSHRGVGKLGAVGIGGAFLGAFVPGCAACGIGIAAALGLSASIAALFPYDGKEISIIVILILIWSIYDTSKNLNSCKIKRKSL